jgi:hypothetical protein
MTNDRSAERSPELTPKAHDEANFQIPPVIIRERVRE